MNRTVARPLIAVALILLSILMRPSSPLAAPATAPSAAKHAATRPLAKAVFAAGCFWCAEASFEGLPGVKAVVSGYAGGTEQNPTYEQVGLGRTGHAESVEITFDPSVMSYTRLLDVFWHNIDPTQANAQFCDHGRQYRSAIFTENESQRRAAVASRKRLEASKLLKAPIVTEVTPITKFWPAEAYHQDYYKTNPIPYQAYRLGCGRDRRLHELWGDAAGKH